MEINCKSCGKSLNIPDEKIPKGKSFSVRCPACREKILVDLKAAVDESRLADAGWSEQGEQQEKEGLPEEKRDDVFAVSGEDYDASEKPFDFLEEEGHTAMVLEEDKQTAGHIKSVLEVMDYNVTAPESIREALRRMKYHQFDLIVLNETFDSSSPDANGVLIYLQRLNMHVRRNIFAALLTERYNTMDNMAAFLKSVNIVINLKDIKSFDRILARGVNENDLFYAVFKESLKKLGRI
ncbi:MAG: zinc-ribbon domain-containing protein [Desulfobacteraceae bacterium]|nr:zinc-ribbon domain-containing protein [Desulfobacteraceae bacterium]